MDVAGGQYTVPFDEPREALFVKVEAPGYKPAAVAGLQAQ